MKKPPAHVVPSVSSVDAAAFDTSRDGRIADTILYRSLVESLTEYAVFAVSPEGIFITWNAGAEKIFGYAAAEVLNESFEIIFTAEDTREGAPKNELSAALHGTQTQHDRWHVRKDGTRFWGTNTVQPLYDAARVLLGFTKLVRDTTQGHLALEQLSDSEQQLRLLVESASDYAIFSMAANGTIKSWNAGAEKVFGYAQAQIVGRNFSLLHSSDDRVAEIPQAELRRATLHGHADIERWLMREDGSRFLASGKIRELKQIPIGMTRGFVVITHDITRHHAAAEDLRRRAFYDELTELPNRRMFFENVARCIGLIKRRATNAFAVLFIDVDHFKTVNDEFGHTVADELLSVTARRLEHCVRSEDIVARLGGDEFAILVSGIGGVEDAADAAARIGVEMRQPVTIEGSEISATVSIGIAIGHQQYQRPEEILRDADTAMYVAKSEGRSRAVLFDASMKSAARRTSDPAADLRLAVTRGELRIAYQPIVRLSDRRLVGFESLVRWQHPLHGLLMPSRFIPAAETSDTILAIDRWMLEAGCRQMAEWLAAGADPRSQISINVSSREFSCEGLLDDLRSVLADSELPPANLRLEITETVVVDRSAKANALFARIREIGVALDIDDFGTGFSTLGALQHIAVDALKIDRSFVAGMYSPIGSSLVQTVIYLAHKLGLLVVAEGIETAEQAALLVEFGCDCGQGFFLSPPLDAPGAGRLLDCEMLPSAS